MDHQIRVYKLLGTHLQLVVRVSEFHFISSAFQVAEHLMMPIGGPPTFEAPLKLRRAKLKFLVLWACDKIDVLGILIRDKFNLHILNM